MAATEKTQLHKRGIAVPSYTTIKDQFIIRVCNTKHHAQPYDFDELVEAVVKLDDELS